MVSTYIFIKKLSTKNNTNRIKPVSIANFIFLITFFSSVKKQSYRHHAYHQCGEIGGDRGD